MALKKTQEEMKRQAERGRKEAKVWKVVNKVMLSTKDLMFKERLAKKLVDRYVGLYTINVKIIDGGLYFIFSFHFCFTFHFIFIFIFLFLEQLRLGFISHAVTSVTK